MAATVRLGAVGLDCIDPSALAEFYRRLLDAEIAYANEAFAAIRVGDIWLFTQRVDDYQRPSWPNGTTPKQLHLDFAVDDLDEAATHAAAVGAVRAEIQPDPAKYLVYLDPAGHPFCLSTSFAGR